MPDYSQHLIPFDRCPDSLRCGSKAVFFVELVLEALAANDLNLTSEEIGCVVDLIVDAMGSMIRAALYEHDARQIHALLEQLIRFCGADPACWEGQR